VLALYSSKNRKTTIVARNFSSHNLPYDRARELLTPDWPSSDSGFARYGQKAMVILLIHLGGAFLEDTEQVIGC